MPRLVEVMERLLSPEGCPWDREQTLESLVPFLVEETYEVVDAIETKGPSEHCEELGDLLMQIVFHAALRKRSGGFNVDDVVTGIVDKLVRRHPHVFGAESGIDTSEQVLLQWDEIKAKEKAGQPKKGALGDVPVAMPPVARAQKLSKRAAKVGFDWPDVAGCRAKVLEEMEELETAATDRAREEELGDLLFACVSLARKMGVNAENALRRANTKFESRFERMEERLKTEGSELPGASLDEMEAAWVAIKKST